jgi:hypothetical protein
VRQAADVDAGRTPAVTWSVLNNGLTPYLRAQLCLADQTFTVRSSRTLLGIVPVGTVERSWRVCDIRDIRVAMWVHVDRLLVLVAAVLLLLLDVVSGAAQVATTVVAVAYVPLSFVAVLRVTAADTVARVPLCLLHIRRGNRISAAVRSAAEHRSPTHC